MTISAYKSAFKIMNVKHRLYKWTYSNIVHLGTPYLLVFLRTGVDDFILIFFGHDIDLVFRQVRLKLFGLLDSARSEPYACIFVKFPCKCVCIGQRWSRIWRSRGSLSSLALATTRARAMHKSSSFRILTTDLFFSKCFSRFTSERLVPLPPIGILNVRLA